MLFYEACVRNRCLIIVEPNYRDKNQPTDPIAYVHEAITGRAVRRVANSFKEVLRLLEILYICILPERHLDSWRRCNVVPAPEPSCDQLPRRPQRTDVHASSVGLVGHDTLFIYFQGPPGLKVLPQTIQVWRGVAAA